MKSKHSWEAKLQEVDLVLKKIYVPFKEAELVFVISGFLKEILK